jgi:hypothetical protein
VERSWGIVIAGMAAAAHTAVSPHYRAHYALCVFVSERHLCKPAFRTPDREVEACTGELSLPEVIVRMYIPLSSLAFLPALHATCRWLLHLQTCAIQPNVQNCHVYHPSLEAQP